MYSARLFIGLASVQELLSNAQNSLVELEKLCNIFGHAIAGFVTFLSAIDSQDNFNHKFGRSRQSVKKTVVLPDLLQCVDLRWIQPDSKNSFLILGFGSAFYECSMHTAETRFFPTLIAAKIIPL